MKFVFHYINYKIKFLLLFYIYKIYYNHLCHHLQIIKNSIIISIKHYHQNRNKSPIGSKTVSIF